jgi:hypothetical protein
VTSGLPQNWRSDQFAHHAGGPQRTGPRDRRNQNGCLDGDVYHRAGHGNWRHGNLYGQQHPNSEFDKVIDVREGSDAVDAPQRHRCAEVVVLKRSSCGKCSTTAASSGGSAIIPPLRCQIASFSKGRPADRVDTAGFAEPNGELAQRDCHLWGTGVRRTSSRSGSISARARPIRPASDTIVRSVS